MKAALLSSAKSVLTISRLRSIAATATLAVVVSPFTATAQPNDPVFLLRKILVKVAGDTKVGSVRSGMLCTPNGGLLWRQIAMPTETAIKEALSAKLRAAGLTIVTGKPHSLGLSIDGASIKVCTAWLGMGNAPKGKGSLSLTWHDLDVPVGTGRIVTMNQELAFDRRDPRVDPAVVLDAIVMAGIEYAISSDRAK